MTNRTTSSRVSQRFSGWFTQYTVRTESSRDWVRTSSRPPHRLPMDALV
jgi:hypothetical protein